MNSKYFIYALVDPETKQIRYIGKTVSGMKRPRDHSKPSELKRNTHKTHWIRTLIEKGLKPEIIVLQHHESKEELNQSEQDWIARYKELGSPLTNATEGGEGNVGWKPNNDTKQKMSKKRSEHYNRVREKDGGVYVKKILHIFDNNKEYKQCLTCKSWLEPNNYYKHSSTWDKLQYMCKECSNKIRSINRKKNPQYKRIMSDEELKRYRQEKVKNMNSKMTTEKRKNFASQPIAGINIFTGEVKRYPSAKSAEIDGFKATKISTAINNDLLYKDYIWCKDKGDNVIKMQLFRDIEYKLSMALFNQKENK